ncbi:MAG TPA: BON domain-containing protein [Thermoanaerobaculia bacterium]|nr:BON domain-containing protein [Thermoanaerobaculia bacterium]
MKTTGTSSRSDGLSDPEIAAAVRHALQWETCVHGTKIRASVVRVNDGKVTLEGRVDRWPDENAIVGAVEHAPGVRRVIDRIRIEPSRKANASKE